MNTEKLFEMQAALDRHIESKHEVTKKNLVERKILALLVEVGELANETRCFKFWSVKGSSAAETILEEYVDGIHFILSLGIEGCFQGTVPAWHPEDSSSPDLTVQFLAVYETITAYRIEQTPNTYYKICAEYFKLGQLLGFTAKDVETAYFEKNKVNYQRQKQGY
ncbi:dUTPase [Peribacillus cavernae]|uniref:dUTPase n=1 Tax=Peribacillus cavernae TaxID=1674310 RepID=A0A433HAV0_9BACI|nr:dUTP diphosphatase [Peribacillus cavernae]MDQ0220109.1 dimeric dUTPase (all-alpha-NTP-PPase superfamily) [Peribacillus cavernae]RUQ25469.1 dUTPase [Peribacillus cavernae]